MDFLEKIIELCKKEGVSEKETQVVSGMYADYLKSVAKGGKDPEEAQPLLRELAEAFIALRRDKSLFSPFHKRVLEPINYYRIGLEFMRPLVDFKRSTVKDQRLLDRIEEQLREGHNVVFLANHQSEADPQIMSLLLEETHPLLAEEMIFVAGHRVTTDPVAVPFSMGRNLLCIFSKKYIDTPPENRAEKLLHNKRTMKVMGELLGEGGKCIYVAPSGGRDRRDENGKVNVAEFDPKSIEMFRLKAFQAKTPCHFYPLALSTYSIFPPPAEINVDLGEVRTSDFAPAHFWVGEEIDMNNMVLPEQETDRGKIRYYRARAAWEAVNELYQKFPT